MNGWTNGMIIYHIGRDLGITDENGMTIYLIASAIGFIVVYFMAIRTVLKD